MGIRISGEQAAALGLAPAVKKLKYRNTPTTVAGVRYDSKKEAERHGELKIMEAAGVITDLEYHATIPLVVNGSKVCDYELDFRYMDGGVLVVEDVKSPATRKNPVYRIKKKLMQAIHNITITEI